MASLHLFVCSHALSPAQTIRKQSAFPESRRDRRGSVACRCAAPPLSTAGTLYSVLGLNVDGTSADIKRAHKELARRYHPDVNPPEALDACTQKFMAVQQAYEILSDTRKKAEYDYAMKKPLSAHTSANSLWGRGSPEADGSIRSPWKRREAAMRRSNASSSSWGARMRQKNSEPFP